MNATKSTVATAATNLYDWYYGGDDQGEPICTHCNVTIIKGYHGGNEWSHFNFSDDETLDDMNGAFVCGARTIFTWL